MASALLRRGLAFAGLPFGWTAQRLSPGVRILMYHRVVQPPAYDQLTVTPQRFAEQMAALAAGHKVVSLDEAVRRLESGGVDEPVVVLTFDDGYRDNLLHAWPVMRRLGLPVTIFVTSSFADQSARHGRYPQEGGQLHLDWDELRGLAAEPGVTIGSHTVSHPYLQRLDDRTARSEIADSRARIADLLGRKVEYFCYPSGDAGEREMRLAAEAGYRASVTVHPGLNRPGIGLQALRRTEITDRDTAFDLGLKLAGAYDPLHAALHARRQRQFKRLASAARATTDAGLRGGNP